MPPRIFLGRHSDISPTKGGKMPYQPGIDQIWLSCPDGIHNNFGIQIMSDNPDRVAEFNRACQQRFWQNSDDNLRFQAFHQGCSAPDWSYWEVWGWAFDGVQDELFAFAQKLADRFGLELDIR